MILEKLKKETASSHKELEEIQLLKPLSSGELTQDKYVLILKYFNSFFYPLEEKVSGFPDLNTYLPDLSERRKSSWLVEDLKTFKSEPLDYHCQEIPEINSVASAFGALYVMEGSTLGGTIISRRVKEELNIKDSAGVSFFSGYKKDTGAKWKTFKESLQRYSEAYPQHDSVIVNTACETFEKLHDWFRKAN